MRVQEEKNLILSYMIVVILKIKLAIELYDTKTLGRKKSITAKFYKLKIIYCYLRYSTVEIRAFSL